MRYAFIWWLLQAVGPFIDPVTKKKIAFIDKGPQEVCSFTLVIKALLRSGSCSPLGLLLHVVMLQLHRLLSVQFQPQ